jgi:phosphoribosylformimino-5-aminoimidazole carboxamide ribotide isomerase
VLVRGWKESAGLDVGDLFDRAAGLPLAGALVTAVHKEGLLGGVDAPLYESLVGRLPVFASGGITTLDDLRRLCAIGVAGAVVGTALYTGDLDGREVAKEMES